MGVLVLPAGTSLTLMGVPPSDGINITGGDLYYGANQTDTSVAYLKTSGAGQAHINAGITLRSNSCTFNGGTIDDDTTGAPYYIDDIGLLGDWIVDGDLITGAKKRWFMQLITIYDTGRWPA